MTVRLLRADAFEWVNGRQLVVVSLGQEDLGRLWYAYIDCRISAQPEYVPVG